MKKILAYTLAAALLLGVLAGCGGATQETAESVPVESTASDTVLTTEVSASTSDPQTEASTVEAAAATGTVLSAEECQTMGYEVARGMYD